MFALARSAWVYEAARGKEVSDRAHLTHRNEERLKRIEELERIYQFDAALLEGVENIARAIDNVGASIETEGLPAAIRHLVSVSQEMIDAYNRREEVILETGATAE